MIHDVLRGRSEIALGFMPNRQRHRGSEAVKLEDVLEIDECSDLAGLIVEDHQFEVALIGRRGHEPNGSDGLRVQVLFDQDLLRGLCRDAPHDESNHTMRRSDETGMSHQVERLDIGELISVGRFFPIDRTDFLADFGVERQALQIATVTAPEFCWQGRHDKILGPKRPTIFDLHVGPTDNVRRRPP